MQTQTPFRAALGPLSPARVQDVLARHPAIAEALAADHAEVLADRARHVAAIAALQAKSAEQGPALLAAVDAARQARDAAAEQLATREAALRAAVGAQMSASQASEHRQRHHETALRDTADPAILDFIVAMDDLFDATNRAPIVVQHEGAPHWLTGKREPATTSRDSIVAAMRVIRRAQETARAMMLDHGRDVASRLAALRAEVSEAVQKIAQ